MRTFLTTPVSELFKKNSAIAAESVMEEKKSSHNIFTRPISELFSRSDAASKSSKAKMVQGNRLEQAFDELDVHYHELLDIYSQIQQFRLNTEIEQVTALLNHFRENFKSYLLLENNALLKNLPNIPLSSEEQQRIMTNYRLEMHRLTNTALRFLKKWTEQRSIDKQNFIHFKLDYEDAFYVLRARAERQNSILPILQSLGK
ncbi:MAG: hypothetical protein E6Q89_09285 [Bacteroidia bacterium]|nr:MAG: hypothetical protein E6Q89_09285 [Bacteroidia bacterium]